MWSLDWLLWVAWRGHGRATSNLRSLSTGTASAVSHLENHSFLFFFSGKFNKTKSIYTLNLVSHMRLEKDQVFIQSPKSILCPKFSSSYKNLINLFSFKKNITSILHGARSPVITPKRDQYIYVRIDIHLVYDSLLQHLYSKIYKKEFIITKWSPSSSKSKSRKKQERKSQRDRERVISQNTDSPEPNIPQEQTEKKVIHVYNNQLPDPFLPHSQGQ